MNKDSPILFVSKSNNHIYRYAGDQRYRNLTTGVAIKIEDEHIKAHAKYPICLNIMAAKNPLLCDLIQSIGAEYEGLESHSTEEELKEVIKSL